MAKQRNREEVINTQLAILISDLGVSADAETILVHGRHRPDVLFQLRGLRAVIEGKFADHPSAEQIVLEDARKRVRSGIAHIAAAAIYPLSLRSAPTTKVIDILKTAQLKYRIVTETHETEQWFEGTPASLMDALRHAQEALTKDDIVEETAKSLSLRLEGITKLWVGQKGACDRLSSILGLIPPKGETSDKAEARRETAAKVSALVLANALIFQEQLAATDGRISPLRKLEREKDIVGATAKSWKWIWENINYVPIFQIGERVLNELPSSPNTAMAVRLLITEAISICTQQAALRHDLMGRIYHWLLHHAKYLGTYYTSVPAATLLLKLAFAAEWEEDFGDPVDLANFKVGDLACGTGTLLMAAASALSDVYIRSRAAEKLPLDVKDMSTLHRALMENVVYGYDVLPSAVHLTASTLAMLAPEVAFVRMNLYVMPLGMDHGMPRLGSLDFLESDEIRTQMALDYSHVETIRTGAAMTQAVNAKVPKLDLCVMNPPFVRSVYGNLLFGSLPDERGELQKELSRRTKKLGVSATVGLGGAFVSLADKQVKPGGRIAFVLPIALATGEAWGQTRNLIASKYHLETVIASHDAERPNFSENTDLSEVLFIARKLNDNEKPANTHYINLWRNPRSIHEALDLAERLITATHESKVAQAGIVTVRSPWGKLGEVVTLPAPTGEENWIGALFAQTQLLRVYWTLRAKKVLALPESNTSFTIPLCKLSDLGELGYDARDIFDAFAVNKTGDEWSPYPAFWDHDANKVFTIAQTSNARLIARTEALPGRKLKSAEAVWAKAGDILLVSRLRTNTQKVLAVGFSENILGNTWWSFRGKKLDTQQRKALLLWLNSSLSLLFYYGSRAITQGAWMQMKKPAWHSLSVLDVRALKKGQLAALTNAYDELAKESLQPLANLDSDDTRRRIDDSISTTLGLPRLAPIRELLAREPGLSARGITPSQQVNDTDEDEE